MANPHCPRCSKEFAYLEGVRSLLSWNPKCPRCAAPLEISTEWKWALGAALAAAGALAGFALYRAAGVPVLFWTLIALLPLSRVAWQLVRFEVKDRA